MSIRLLARDLYRLQLELDQLEKALADAPIDRRDHLQTRVTAARAERDRLRRALDGQKDAPAKPRR